MEVTKETFDWYKDLVVANAFMGVDPKTVTDDMVKSVIAKGWLDVKSVKRLLCLKCGSKMKVSQEVAQQEKVCPFCYNEFSF